jgi:hypothetical protein
MLRCCCRGEAMWSHDLTWLDVTDNPPPPNKSGQPPAFNQRWDVIPQSAIACSLGKYVRFINRRQNVWTIAVSLTKNTYTRIIDWSGNHYYFSNILLRLLGQQQWCSPDIQSICIWGIPAEGSLISHGILLSGSYMYYIIQCARRWDPREGSGLNADFDDDEDIGKRKKKQIKVLESSTAIILCSVLSMLYLHSHGFAWLLFRFNLWWNKRLAD